MGLVPGACGIGLSNERLVVEFQRLRLERECELVGFDGGGPLVVASRCFYVGYCSY